MQILHSQHDIIDLKPVRFDSAAKSLSCAYYSRPIRIRISLEEAKYVALRLVLSDDV
jgi:hypothetical protein